MPSATNCWSTHGQNAEVIWSARTGTGAPSPPGASSSRTGRAPPIHGWATASTPDGEAATTRTAVGGPGRPTSDIGISCQVRSSATGERPIFSLVTDVGAPTGPVAISRRTPARIARSWSGRARTGTTTSVAPGRGSPAAAGRPASGGTGDQPESREPEPETAGPSVCQTVPRPGTGRGTGLPTAVAKSPESTAGVG